MGRLLKLLSMATIAIFSIQACASYEGVPDCAADDSCNQQVSSASEEQILKEEFGVVRAKDRESLGEFFQVHEVLSPYHYPAGTIIVDTPNKLLYLMEEKGLARRYPIAVGKEGYSFAGNAVVGRKVKWPQWRPTPDMFEKNPDLEEVVDGGPRNPLGARAIYLYANGRDTLYRIHGTNAPTSIGRGASSGCIRMFNEDVIDVYERVQKGAPVIVIPKDNVAEGEKVDIIEDPNKVEAIDDPIYDFATGRATLGETVGRVIGSGLGGDADDANADDAQDETAEANTEETADAS